jgi:hypothetical protein
MKVQINVTYNEMYDGHHDKLYYIILIKKNYYLDARDKKILSKYKILHELGYKLNQVDDWFDFMGKYKINQINTKVNNIKVLAYKTKKEANKVKNFIESKLLMREIS